MPRLYLLFIFGLVLLMGSYSSQAQQLGHTITGNFANLRFEQFAQQVEAQTPYRFYFNPPDVDSLVINLEATNLPLPAALSQVFEHSSLRFAIDESTNRVFVTPGYPLQTQLPEAFFQQSPTAPIATTATEPTDTPLRPGRVAIAGSSEFKLYEVGSRQAVPASGRATLTGVVRFANTGAPVLGAAIYIESPTIGVATDRQGMYTLTIPVGRHNLHIRGIGIQSTRRQIWVHSDGRLDLEVTSDATSLQEVVVQGQREGNVRSMQMGV